MLKNCDDPKVKAAFNHRKERLGDSKQWNYVKELGGRERDLYFQELVGTISSNRQGLGFDTKGKLPNERDRLKQLIATISESDMQLTLYNKNVQGRFLTWENTMQLDLGWNSLIYSYNISPELLKFHLNAIHDTAHAPANMNLQKYSNTGKCPLCNWRNCNLKHILTGCRVALEGRRYNWRHDQVLRVICRTLSEDLNSKASRPKKKWLAFRSKDGKYKTPHKKWEGEIRALDQAEDWTLVHDEDENKKGFPQHITNTPRRPDVVVY